MAEKLENDNSPCDEISLIEQHYLQDFAAIIVLDETSQVLFFSMPFTQILGLEAEKILKQPFSSLFIGQERLIAQWLKKPLARHYQPVLSKNSQRLWFRKQKIGGKWLIEIEPEASQIRVNDYPLFLEKLTSLKQSGKEDKSLQGEWLENLVNLIFHALAMDVVRIYQFNEDYSGTVVAEKIIPSHPSYLHYRFPASDVPKPVRKFFEQYLYRYIPDIHAEETLIIPVDEKVIPLLVAADCRQIAAVHKEYLNNMGVRAAFTVPILIHGKLWGLLACQHRLAKYIHPQDRFYCRLLVEHFAMQLSLLEEAQKNQNKILLLNIYESLNEKFAKEESLSTALKKELPELINMMNAAGAVGIVEEEYLSTGKVPKHSEIECLLKWLDKQWKDGLFYCHDLTRRFPKVLKFSTTMHGLLAMQLTKSGKNVLIFFREEVIKTIEWAGNPKEAVKMNNSNGAYSPRSSFSSWLEKVSGISQSWSEKNLELASALRRILKDKLLNQTLQQKTYLDPLTQLFNRRYLNERIQSDVKDRRKRKNASCVAMIDVDDFKGINDRFGHPTGDKLLKQIAKCLRQELRASDIICRYGGDEFIAILNNCNSRDCEYILKNVLQKVRQLEVSTKQNQMVSTTLSIGFSASDKPNRKLSTLISRADEALYQAKEEGKNQVVNFANLSEL